MKWLNQLLCAHLWIEYQGVLSQWELAHLTVKPRDKVWTCRECGKHTIKPAEWIPLNYIERR